FDFFAPFVFAADVAEGTPIEIPLTRWRRLFVKLASADGKPWRQPLARPTEDATTRPRGFGFMTSGRAPRCVLVAASAPLPSQLGPSAPTVAQLGARPGARSGCFGIDMYEGFAPSVPLRVGIYDDGRLVGSADVPAVAPSFEPELPAAAAGIAS